MGQLCSRKKRKRIGEQVAIFSASSKLESLTVEFKVHPQLSYHILKHRAQKARVCHQTYVGLNPMGFLAMYPWGVSLANLCLSPHPENGPSECQKMVTITS